MGTSATIHVGSGTTYWVPGAATPSLADIAVGMFVAAEGTLRSDGSLSATVVLLYVYGGRRDHRRRLRPPGRQVGHAQDRLQLLPLRLGDGRERLAPDVADRADHVLHKRHFIGCRLVYPSRVTLRPRLNHDAFTFGPLAQVLPEFFREERHERMKKVQCLLVQPHCALEHARLGILIV